MGERSNSRLENAFGTVKWFDPKKGFGFIVGPADQDVFIHYSRIEGDGFRAFEDGQRVEFDAEQGERGWHAIRARGVSSEAEKID